MPWQNGRFATGDGKFHFPEPMDLRIRTHASDARFPLLLLTYKPQRHLLSQHAGSRELPIYEVRLHPHTAARLDVSDGRQVRVISEIAEIPAIVRVDAAQHEQVAAMPLSGSVARGTAVNLLAPAVMAGDGACPAYNDTRVRIEPV